MRIAASLRVTALRFTVASVKAKNSEVQPYHKAGAGLQSAGRSAPWSKVSRFRRPLAASGRYAETGSTAAPGRTGTYVWYPSVAAFRCTKRQRAPTDLIPESEAPGTKYLVPGTRCVAPDTSFEELSVNRQRLSSILTRPAVWSGRRSKTSRWARLGGACSRGRRREQTTVLLID